MIESVRMFEKVDRAVQALNAAHAEVLLLVGEVDADGSFEREGATSITGWLRGRHGLTKATASEWARVARVLRDLPAISEAFSKGLVSFEQLRPLTRFATFETDGEWARKARPMSAPELWDEARRHQRIREREHSDAHRKRDLCIDWNEERTEFFLQARGGAEQGVALERAILERSQEIVLTDEPYNGAGARLADALVELVTGSKGESSPPMLVIHADAAVLSGEEAPGSLCETEDGTRMSAEAVRRLACQARMELVLEREGRPVGIGRAGRIPPAWLRRSVRYRDRSCVFPGCGRIRWLHAHHLVHWTRGGRTDLDNLVMLCQAHHRLVHEGGWSIRGRPGRELRFHDPGGREPFLRQAELAVA